jgi:hypothetical protein
VDTKPEVTPATPSVIPDPEPIPSTPSKFIVIAFVETQYSTSLKEDPGGLYPAEIVPGFKPSDFRNPERVRAMQLPIYDESNRPILPNELEGHFKVGTVVKARVTFAAWLGSRDSKKNVLVSVPQTHRSQH